MKIADRIKLEDYEGNLEGFLLAHDIKNIAVKRLLDFVKRMTDIGDLCCLQDVEEMAISLLKELGEIE